MILDDYSGNFKSTGSFPYNGREKRTYGFTCIPLGLFYIQQIRSGLPVKTELTVLRAVFKQAVIMLSEFKVRKNLLPYIATAMQQRLKLSLLDSKPHVKP